MNLIPKQEIQNLKHTKSHSIINNNILNPNKIGSCITPSKQNYLKGNKSIEKYLAKKLDGDDVNESDNTNLFLSTNSFTWQINNSMTSKNRNNKIKSTPINSNQSHSNTRFNLSSSENKNCKKYCTENLKKINQINSDKKEHSRGDMIPVDFFSNKISSTLEFNGNLNHSKNNLKDITSGKVSKKTTLLYEHSPLKPQEESFYDSRLKELKSELIDLINQTKDKSMIIRELDFIYMNVLKLQNPFIRTRVETQNLVKNSSNEDSNLSNCYSNSYNSYISNRLVTSTSDKEILKNENKFLKSKIIELEEKLNLIHQENQDLKTYIKDKSKNFDFMENVLKKFEIDINEVKNMQIENSANHERLNFEIDSQNKLSDNDKSNLSHITSANYSFTKENSFYSNSVTNPNIQHMFKTSEISKSDSPNHTTLSSVIKNTHQTSKHNVNSMNSKFFSGKHQRLSDVDFLIEEESPEILQTSVSIPRDELMDFSYLPAKVSNTSIKINGAIEIPRLNFDDMDSQLLDSESELESPKEEQNYSQGVYKNSIDKANDIEVKEEYLKVNSPHQNNSFPSA